jgi:hypothetical protein
MREWISLVETLNRAFSDKTLLYHGTNLIYAASIVEDGHIFDGYDDAYPVDQPGVSFTTALSVAKHFAVYRSENMLDDDAGEWPYRGAVFVIDPARMRDVRLQHYTDGSIHDEDEVRAFTESLGVGLTALVAIHADGAEIDHILSYLQSENGHTDNPHQNIPRLRALRTHPLLRPWP